MTSKFLKRRASDTVEEAQESVEPRITRLEAEMAATSRNIDALTKDIRELTNAVGRLNVAVTTAAAPKKTEWGVIFSGFGIMITVVTCLGGMALTPLWSQIVSLEKNFNVQSARHVEEAEAAAENQESRYHLILATANEKMHSLEAIVKDIKENGSSITRERLAVLEHEVLRGRAQIEKSC